MRTRRKTRGLHPSMLDVAFTLVIMFLMLSTLANTTQQEAREKSLPPIDLTAFQENSQQLGSTRVKSVAVTVSPGPVFYVDNQKVPFTELAEKVKGLNPPEVELRGDNTVPYGEIAKALKALTEAGIHNVALTFKSGN